MPFYIGKGQGNRALEHEQDARLGKRSSLCDRIREIQSRGEHVHKKILFESDNEQAVLRIELQQIQLHRHLSLTNRLLYSHKRAATNDRLVEVTPVDFVCREEQRLVVQLATSKELGMYRKLKMIAAAKGKSIKDIVLQSLNRTVDEELPSLLKKEQK